MADLGLTHVALPVADLDASLAFYRKYAALERVHERADAETGSRVAWISDGRRPFVVVLIQSGKVESPLLPLAHLGVGVASREEVDRAAAEARREGYECYGPVDAGEPVGYFALISDPDRHTLEVSHGQEVALTVERAAGA